MKNFFENFVTAFLCIMGILAAATTFAWAGIIVYGIIRFVRGMM